MCFDDVCYDHIMNNTSHKRFLKLEELETATVFTIVWDKNATRYFKLTDGSWASSDLNNFSNAELLKIRVKFDPTVREIPL